jgi:hypothetical protein
MRRRGFIPLLGGVRIDGIPMSAIYLLGAEQRKSELPVEINASCHKAGLGTMQCIRASRKSGKWLSFTRSEVHLEIPAPCRRRRK